MTDKVSPLDSYYKFLRSVSGEVSPGFFKKAEEVVLGQWETPFEALLLELMKNNASRKNICITNANYLAEQSGIIPDGVLDPNTWGKFWNWFYIEAS